MIHHGEHGGEKRESREEDTEKEMNGKRRDFIHYLLASLPSFSVLSPSSCLRALRGEIVRTL